jgi:hypothetical protein
MCLGHVPRVDGLWLKRIPHSSHPLFLLTPQQVDIWQVMDDLIQESAVSGCTVHHVYVSDSPHSASTG